MGSHTKTILIDDRLSLVGSYNLDMRSTYLDTEMMLAVDCEELSRKLYEMRELSVGKKVCYGILRIVIRPVRHLL